ncbi:MAG: recombinase RecA [Candidatus Methanoperedens sp.]|nr:recombinase RecA [Candidatus Methanoperedens sp.]MCZ7369091.1 recombinase RecA [Candidatus Methanoperedens sp.]
MSDYKLGIEELDNAIGGIRNGTNIMLVGPPMIQKEIILYNIMFHGAEINENALITVTTHESPTQILEWFKENKMVLPLSRIGIIDCITKSIGVTAIETENIKFASSPVDLTGIGVRISQFFEDFLMKKKLLKIQLHINSLSGILMYSNIQTVFRFMHVLTGRVKAAGALGIFVIEVGMHDDHTIATLKQLFDGIIEIKEENDKNYIRIVGLSSKPTLWLEYEIEGGKLRINR